MDSSPHAKASGRVEVYTIAGLTALGALSFVLMAFFTERIWAGEERVLQNVPYTYVHEGKLAFPVYGYYDRANYDRMIMHSPTHYWEIGCLMKLGLPLYYAEATPALLWAIAVLLVITTSAFPFRLKSGLLCGSIAAVGLVATIGNWDYGVHLRPDADTAFSLLAGFLLLAASQVQGWEVHRMFLGSLAVTYGSTIHYPGGLAWLGVLIFLWAASRSLAWKEYRVRLTASILGASLAGVPYLLYHLLPNRAFLAQFSGQMSLTNIWQTIQLNLPIYRGAVQELAQWHFPQLFYALPSRLACAWSIPPFVVAFTLLIVHKPTRVLAWGFLPYPLFLFAILGRKLWSYLYFENSLLLIGVWLLVTMAWFKLAEFLPASRRWIAGPSLALLFLTSFWRFTPELQRVELKKHRHELPFLRERSKEILGSNATVASILPFWYIGGGRRWFDLSSDLLLHLPQTNLPTFLSRFDAVAMFHLSFYGTQTGVNEASLFDQGTLRMRGFMASRDSLSTRWVLLSEYQSKPVRGFFWRDDRFFRFDEAPNGRLALVSLRIAGDYEPFVRALAPIQYWALDLPKNPDQSQPYVLVLLMDAARYERGDALLSQARVVEMIRGNAEQLNPESLPAAADADPIDIPRSYSELLALLAQPSNSGLRTSLELQPYANHAAVDQVAGKTDWLRVTSTGKLTSEWLVSAQTPALIQSRYYRINLNVDMETGGIATSAVQDGVALQTLYREIPLAHARESFVVQSQSNSPVYLVIAAANERTGASAVRFRVSAPVVEEVTIPDKPD